MISKLHPIISNGLRKEEEYFSFNKDAGMFACPKGHLAIRVAKTGKKRETNRNQVMTYYFDVEKCKTRLQREGCYKEGAKTKIYSVSIKSDLHENHKEFQETAYFKEHYRERYMIEAKNSELKSRYGYGVVNSSGPFGMQIQGGISIFTVNIKRILTILRNK